METAKKFAECSCGTSSEVVCDGCGKPVCSACFTREICSLDTKNIKIKHYCPQCSRDIRKNVWGTLYWKNLISLFN